MGLSYPVPRSSSTSVHPQWPSTCGNSPSASFVLARPFIRNPIPSFPFPRPLLLPALFFASQAVLAETLYNEIRIKQNYKETNKVYLSLLQNIGVT